MLDYRTVGLFGPSDYRTIGLSDYRSDPDFIVDVIENGYQIPFLTLPNQIELDNNKSARENPDFVTDEINKLLEKGCMSLVTDKPHVINPLTVANNGS